MQRNKDPIIDKSGVANAVRTVYQIVQCLKLSRSQFEDMVRIDVLNQIKAVRGAPNRMLISYCQGLVGAYVTVILTEHCQFVYRDVEGTWYLTAEVINLGEDFNRSAATCCHAWNGNDFPFTEWEDAL